MEETGGTDIYQEVADKLGISRDEAKEMLWFDIYGARIEEFKRRQDGKL